MNENLDKFYDENFYEEHIEGMSKSAAIVLGLLYEHYNPQRVIDIGCGQGAWLAAAESLGAKILKGLDGEWVTKEALLSKNIDFMAVNFDEAMPELKEKYDLCISLEVAEHISQANAKRFIDLLCEVSDMVLFSAAIKYQGGRNHINEQWQSYWVDLFNSNGYECLDLFRGRLWNNMSVRWWYRQNTFLFVAPNNLSLNFEALRALENPILDIAHPLNYEKKANSYRNSMEYPTLRFCLGCIKRYIRNKLRRPPKIRR
jgi:hypothetical protein